MLIIDLSITIAFDAFELPEIFRMSGIRAREHVQLIVELGDSLVIDSMVFS